jgi:flagellar biosynthesis/type III secretory pathway chaperone
MNDYNLEAIQIMVAKDQLISQQLLNLLNSETTSIKDRNYESVKSILLDKVPLLDQLQKHADLRKQWLLSLYKVANENNWRNFIASFKSPEIHQQWEAVNQTITDCKKINEKNGVLITRGKKTYSQLLRIVKGDVQQETLYTARGNKQSTRAYSTVAKA